MAGNIRAKRAVGFKSLLFQCVPRISGGPLDDFGRPISLQLQELWPAPRLASTHRLIWLCRAGTADRRCGPWRSWGDDTPARRCGSTPHGDRWPAEIRDGPRRHTGYDCCDNRCCRRRAGEADLILGFVPRWASQWAAGVLGAVFVLRGRLAISAWWGGLVCGACLYAPLCLLLRLGVWWLAFG